MFKTIQMFFLLFSCLNMAFLLYLQRILMILWILNLFTTNFISYTMAKTKQIVECVPNFSEGRDMNIIRQITDAVESVKGVKLLDVDPGEATNRTVVTFVGEPDDVVEAAFRAVGKAGQLIDMRQHHGAHPRIGATDVLPIVPVSGITLEECAEISRKLAKRIADELNIPCYCYEAAAFTPERQNLAVCRKGEYEGIAERIDDDAEAPDFGRRPFDEQVARTGCTVVGARDFLIAVNFNLNTTSTRRANAIAFDVREKGRPMREGNPITGKKLLYADGHRATAFERVYAAHEFPAAFQADAFGDR